MLFRSGDEVAKSMQTAKASLNSKLPSYKVGERVLVSRKLFINKYSPAKSLAKLSSWRFRPFKILCLVGKCAFKLVFPSHIRTNNVMYVSFTRPVRNQPIEIVQSRTEIPISVEIERTGGTEEFEVDAILAHRRGRNGFQSMTLMKKSPTHKTECQPTTHFWTVTGQ